MFYFPLNFNKYHEFYHLNCDLINTVHPCSAESGFDFITIPIVNPRYEREFHPDKPASKRQGPITRSDLLLASSDWSSLVVGRISPTIDVDSKVPHIRANSEARLAEELRLFHVMSTYPFSE